MYEDSKLESDPSRRQTGWRDHFSSSSESASSIAMDDSIPLVSNTISIVPMRRRNRWTYIHVAIHFLCLVYLMTRSPDCSSTFYTWRSNVLSAHHHHGLQQESQSDSSTTAFIAPLGVEDDGNDLPVDYYDPFDIEDTQPANPPSTDSDARKYPARFPKQVWQTASEEDGARWTRLSQTWQELEGWQYNLLNDEDADVFVHDYFSEKWPAIVHFWDALMTPTVKANLLRYLLMFELGGIYSEIDTDVLMHPDQWIPFKYDERNVNVVVGIEYDDDTDAQFVRPISFSQWTLMSKPGHPISEIAIHRTMSNLEFMARRSRVELSDLVPSKADIAQGTGPCMLTDVVMQVIRDQGYDIEWGTFHNLKEPILFGDVLVLPVNAFAGAQKHSNSGKPEYGQKFVGHHFGRSWYSKRKE